MPDVMNRIDHFAWVARAQNIAQYVDRLRLIFDRGFDHRYGPDYGSPIDMYIDWQGGLEVIAPVPNADGAPFDPRTQATAHKLQAHLDEHGEGPFGLIFRVPDLAAATARLNGLGYDIQDVVPGSPGREARVRSVAQWTKHVIDIDERFVEKFLGTNLLLGAFEYPDETGSTP